MLSSDIVPGAFFQFRYILTPLGIRPPITRLAAGVLGRNLDIDAGRAKRELGWRSRITLDEAMSEIERWVREHYINSSKGGHA
ncbi:MAG TPA: hypothetical protein PK544_19180 [Spirochaetota bacterium]|nr:hypothetical protein [Spirochaetota bacterium]HPQ55425.1 hypothetical protein [Spirochaetota bacterium]